MGSIDYSSELGDTYLRLMREYRAAGKQPHQRPAANRDEALRAAEVRRKLDSVVIGYRGSPDGGWMRETEAEGTPRRLYGRCARCGGRMQPGTARLWRQVWSSEGRQDMYVHAGACPRAKRHVGQERRGARAC